MPGQEFFAFEREGSVAHSELQAVTQSPVARVLLRDTPEAAHLLPPADQGLLTATLAIGGPPAAK